MYVYVVDNVVLSTIRCSESFLHTYYGESFVAHCVIVDYEVLPGYVWDEIQGLFVPASENQTKTVAELQLELHDYSNNAYKEMATAYREGVQEA